MNKACQAILVRLFLAAITIAMIVTAGSCSKGTTDQRKQELVKADTIMEQAYSYYDNADFGKSIDLCREAMQTYIEQKDSAALSDAYSHLSACYQRMTMNDSALINCFSGLRIDEKLNDKDRLSSSYNNLAAIYLGINKPQEAKPFINKAIDYERSIKPLRASKLSIRYGIAAEIYLKLNKADSALNFISKSLEIDSAAADTIHIGRRLAVRGDIYNAMNKRDEALKSYTEAIELLTITGDKYSLALTYKNLAQLHEKMGDPLKALECLEQSTTLAKQCNARQILQQNYYSMGTTSANISHNQAVEYLKLSTALKDSIYNDATSDLASHYNMKIEAQHKQITIEEQQHALTKQRLIIIAILIALLLLLLGFAALFVINLLRSRAQRAEKNAEQMKEMFFTNITHEFRTPLTVILGETQTLLSSDTSGLHSQQYKAIVNQGNHMLDLVNQLLSISKVKSGIGDLEWQHGDISMMAKMIVENMRLNAENKGIELDVECDEANYEIDFVPEYCHSIITNLIANSLKFTSHGGKVRVIMERTSSKVIIKVSDTGEGIKAKDLPHIFDLFYQGDNENASLGTGIGLALVKQMTEAMNGKISLESKENEGTTFTISLPVKYDKGGFRQWVPKLLSMPMGHDDIVKQAAASDSAPSEDTEDKPIVLVVEDNHDVAMFIEHMLEEEYNVIKAQDGEQGLLKARETVPDIIITDVIMPNIDGFEMCRRIRADELINHIPIVVVTARSDSKDRLEAISAGADAMLVKPFNNQEFKALAQALLTSRQMLRQKFQLEMRLNDDSRMPSQPITSPLLSKDNAFMDKVKKIITKNIDQSEMNSTFIADKMNLSQRQLNRKVKSMLGVDTASYIREVRISIAKQLLSTTEDPVTEIAEKCGFDSGSYFSKTFKQLTGLTPSDYRKAFAQ